MKIDINSQITGLFLYCDNSQEYSKKISLTDLTNSLINKLLTDSQYGFRSMTLMELIENITNNIDQRQGTVGVLT